MEEITIKNADPKKPNPKRFAPSASTLLLSAVVVFIAKIFHLINGWNGVFVGYGSIAAIVALYWGLDTGIYAYEKWRKGE